jgi:hypothetical protein
MHLQNPQAIKTSDDKHIKKLLKKYNVQLENKDRLWIIIIV